MRKKVIIGSIMLLLVAFIGLFWFSGREQEALPKEREVLPVAMTKKELASVQDTFHNEGFGFIHDVYSLDEHRHLFVTRTRDTDYADDFPADQLVWVEQKGDKRDVKALATGDANLRLVLNKKEPYFTQDGIFYFVFYEAEGTKEMPRKGKGHVYQVNKKQGVEKVYETEGDYDSFAINKQNRMVVVEKVEAENRNLYPSFFAPYVLNYRQYSKEKWTTIETKQVEPDLQEVYEVYEEKQTKK